MERKEIKEYLQILKTEISPALGCTEPAAVALAVAYAAKELGCPVQTVRVNVSQYIFKNGMNVGIPGTGMIGLEIAAALGSLSAAPEKQLLVLNGLSDGQKQAAKKMSAEKAVKVGIADTEEKIYIQAIVENGSKTAQAVIAGTHTNLVLLKRGEQVIEEHPLEKQD